MTSSEIGILLTNIGSPDHPTPAAVRQYLKQFLSDPRVVELPRLLWWPILHGVILRHRPQRSAKLYQQIWTDHGSPLLYHSEKIAQQLRAELNIPVELGMHYGKPSISSGLAKLTTKKIIVLPLYPQYSATTTAATFDRIAAALKKRRHIPDISTIHHYADDENYIQALCDSIQKHDIQHLLFSFHGIPERYINQGDPYLEHCKKTVHGVVNTLRLTSNQWTLAFQSRLGRLKWLSPYTDKILQELPKRGIKDLHVICPGFAVDCLETLEEIAIRGKKQFLAAGGNSFHYIPALNDDAAHIKTLKEIILQRK